MTSGRTVAVFGAYGHTGRFVVAELADRGFVPVPSGRDAGRLEALGQGLDVRPATADDPASLDRALAGTAAVINCAGPFASTAVLSTVFPVLGVVRGAYGLTSTYVTGWQTALDLPVLLLGLAAVALVWREEAGPYFRPGQLPRRQHPEISPYL